MGRLGEALPDGMPDCVRGVVGQYFQPGAREAVAGLGGLGAYQWPALGYEEVVGERSEGETVRRNGRVKR
jgi:hypothetical protein